MKSFQKELPSKIALDLLNLARELQNTESKSNYSFNSRRQVAKELTQNFLESRLKNLDTVEELKLKAINILLEKLKKEENIRYSTLVEVISKLDKITEQDFINLTKIR